MMEVDLKDSSSSGTSTDKTVSSDIRSKSTISTPKRKEERFLPKRELHKRNKLRDEFDQKSASAISFRTYTIEKNEERTSSTGPYIKGPRVTPETQGGLMKRQILESCDPFIFQEFYELNDTSEGSSESANSALQLQDLKDIIVKNESKKTSTSENSVIIRDKISGIEDEDQAVGYETDVEQQSSNEKQHGKRWFNIVGIILMATGVLSAAIIPIVAYLVDASRPPSPTIYEKLTAYQYPMLSALRTSLVDPDTPREYHHKVATDGATWDLVFSDEFNAEGRSFYSNEDQFFEAVDIHYAATNDLEWYSPDAITTRNGSLTIRLDAFKNNGLHYRSGMLQSWNKMCFTQGLVEISARMPGAFESKGFWPGLWSLGNLARAGYMASTEGVWPYTYHACDAGITPNQSSPDGLSSLPGQKLNSCTCRGEDHPNRGVGRGAPELDILEGTFTKDMATFAQTVQVAPFDPWWIPDYTFMEVKNKTTSYMNSYVGTSQQEAISVITTSNSSWFEKVREKNGKEVRDQNQHFQTYSLEFRSDHKQEEDNYATFQVGPDETFRLQGSTLHPEGNIDWREISKEPMSMVFNLGISYAWSDIQWNTLQFPADLEIDYIRIYQPAGKTSVTCDPPERPTVDYIEGHLNAYMNPNLTSWEQAGYTFPKNRLMHGCK